MATMGSLEQKLDAVASNDPRERRSRLERSKSSKDRDKESRESLRHTKSHRSSRSISYMNGSSVSSTHHRRHRTTEKREEDHEKREGAKMEDTVPELVRASLVASRVSLPYPTFSKAHSKENMKNRDNLGTSPQRDPLTPDPTDLETEYKRRFKSTDDSKLKRKSSRKDDRPPSPPETDLSNEKKLRHKTSSPKRHSDGPERTRSRASGVSRSISHNEDKSRLSTKSKASSQATLVKPSMSRPPPFVQIVNETTSNLSDARTAGAQSNVTPVPPKRSTSTKSAARPNLEAEDSPESAQDSSPKTPTATAQFPLPRVLPDENHVPVVDYNYVDQEHPTPVATPAPDFGPPPPPPPPPPLDIQEVPKVDYLLQNGGLNLPVSRNFLSVLPRQNGSRPSNPPLIGCETLFAPFFNLLDQYQSVLQKHGSIAVATGHKSVARRLLDRLEDVFSRDLPVQGCACVMCERTPEEHRGLGWGEVLERVGGRVDMPSWPPFDLSSVVASAIENTADLPPRPASPVKLDPDVAEEFREHYLRQTRKVKSSVDKWMNKCATAPAPLPSEVDDETLAFAILTSLDQEERPYFNALFSGVRELQPIPRAPTPVRKSRSDFLVKTGLQLQRLYRLMQAPRDAETAAYLVKNPFHHDLLATMHDISPQEWEILISGRFDGFLWSGADAEDAITPTTENPLPRGATPASGIFPPPPTRPAPMTPGMNMRQTPGFGASRSTTPFSGIYSRGPTPASFVSGTSSMVSGQNRQPVSHDEEVEMAILAEVEREIYQGMEALEDAFEKLHHRAELVRNALRERNNGLLMSQQHRRARRIDVLSEATSHERPAWAASDDDGVTSDSDWFCDDYDIAPEDSASNISSARHRRPKRRNERRTPAPIEEDDEEN